MQGQVILVLQIDQDVVKVVKLIHWAAIILHQVSLELNYVAAGAARP